jgi:hypothetical protein
MCLKEKDKNGYYTNEKFNLDSSPSKPGCIYSNVKIKGGARSG